jgi:hypothetical protein
MVKQLRDPTELDGDMWRKMKNFQSFSRTEAITLISCIKYLEAVIRRKYIVLVEKTWKIAFKTSSGKGSRVDREYNTSRTPSLLACDMMDFEYESLWVPFFLEQNIAMFLPGSSFKVLDVFWHCPCGAKFGTEALTKAHMLPLIRLVAFQGWINITGFSEPFCGNSGIPTVYFGDVSQI